MFHTHDFNSYANFYLSHMLFAASLCTFQTPTCISLSCMPVLHLTINRNTNSDTNFCYLSVIIVTPLSCTFQPHYSHVSFLCLVCLSCTLQAILTPMLLVFVVFACLVSQAECVLTFHIFLLHVRPHISHLSLACLSWTKLTSTWMFAFHFVHFQLNLNMNPNWACILVLQLPTACLVLLTHYIDFSCTIVLHHCLAPLSCAFVLHFLLSLCLENKFLHIPLSCILNLLSTIFVGHLCHCLQHVFVLHLYLACFIQSDV